MKLCIPTLVNYDGVEALIRSAEAGSVKPTEYIVLDNGGNYTADRLRAMHENAILPPNIMLVSPGKNLGVAASWNYFLGRYGRDEPIVISNDDMVLGKTAFALLQEYANQGAPRAGFGWALFMQRPECTAKVGYYDENFWPAYYEDIDYIIRMRRAGVPDVRLEGKIDVTHGGWTTTNKLGDPTWLSDGRARNQSYLIAKWGTSDYGTPYEKFFNGKPPAGWHERKRLPPLPLRWDIVNAIAKKIGAERYLELGLADGSCIRRIEVRDKWGVDKVSPADAGGAHVFAMTTDEFFALDNKLRYGLVFIDADHAHEQVSRDVQNAIRVLRPGGVIVMHDCSPWSRDMQVVPHNGASLWTGDVWKTIVRLRWEGQHATRVVDSDYGVGIVIPGGTPHHFTRRPRKPEVVTYDDLVADRENLLGLVSGWEWEEWFDEAYTPAKENFIAKYLRTASPEELACLDGLAELDRQDFAIRERAKAWCKSREDWDDMRHIKEVDGTYVLIDGYPDDGEGGTHYSAVWYDFATDPPVCIGPGKSPNSAESEGGLSMVKPDLEEMENGPLAQAITQTFDEAVIGMLSAGQGEYYAETRIGDGEETFADIIAEKAQRAVADADPARDTLVVIFSVLPRPDTTGTHLLRAFERLGIRVVHYEPLLAPEHYPRTYEITELACARAVLCIDDDHGWPVPETPGIRRYYWCIDTYRMDAALYLGGTRRERLRLFDKNFFVQQKEAREFGGEWLPVGVDLTLYRYEPKDQVYDFCFIGNQNHARTEFLRRLIEVFPRSFVGQAYGEAANTIYNQSLLAVNYSAGGDINMRMFEAQATSALLLSNRINNGEAELLPYIPLYDDFEECVSMMRLFIKNAALRRGLSAVQAESMVQHTYEARARQFLRAIGWPGF